MNWVSIYENLPPYNMVVDVMVGAKNSNMHKIDMSSYMHGENGQGDYWLFDVCDRWAHHGFRVKKWKYITPRRDNDPIKKIFDKKDECKADLH
jgi:hypothetical protein